VKDSDLSWTINKVVCTPPDACHDVVSWDPAKGCVFTDTRTPLNILPTVQRFTSSLPDGRVALFYNSACTQWNGHWKQSDEPHKDYCGPTAGRNLLDWYGEEVTYNQLGSEMDTDNWMSTLNKATQCFFSVCSGEALCTAACYDVFNNFLDVGTLPEDMANALSHNSPPGYRIYLRKENTGLLTFENLLREGDPIVVLVWTGSELHWTVVTGTEDSGASVMVELANGQNQTWDSFVDQWSFKGLETLKRKVVSWKGFDPYIWMYYQKTTELTAGQEILRGKSITSSDGRFILILDIGGNLVLYPLPIVGGPPDNHLWRSNTARSDAQVALMQFNGNFVIYDSKHKALWSSRTSGHPGAYLALQNDGNVVIYGPDNTSVLWTTGTCCH
jgi:hypothetical protein